MTKCPDGPIRESPSNFRGRSLGVATAAPSGANISITLGALMPERSSMVFPRLAAAALLACTATGLAAQELAPVTLTEARLAPVVEELRLTGTLTSPRVARLAPQVEGRVAAIEVDAGSRVAAGDTVLRLDDELARLQVAQAGAARREAVAELEDARRRLSELSDLAQREGIVPESDVRAAAAEVERDSAVVERRKAELALAEALLRRHQITAPFDGVIAARSSELGEWVGTDTQVLELVAVDALRLDVQVPQGYFGRITTDTPVTLRLDPMREARIETKITEIVPVSDPTARTFLARIDLDNAQGRMTPGMSAQATLRMDTGQEGVVVPRDALVRYPDGRIVVWVASVDGDAYSVSERQVRSGLSAAGQVEILSGLKAGSQVVVGGNEALREGQRVRVATDG
jgi:RND family efflux transporter MFP subunit